MSLRRNLKNLRLSHIAAVKRPAQEGALAVIMKSDDGDARERFRAKSIEIQKRYGCLASEAMEWTRTEHPDLFDAMQNAPIIAPIEKLEPRADELAVARARADFMKRAHEIAKRDNVPIHVGMNRARVEVPDLMLRRPRTKPRITHFLRERGCAGPAASPTQSGRSSPNPREPAAVTRAMVARPATIGRGLMDAWTGETVRAMCRYISDDARIARHVGCSIADVERVRKQVRGNMADRMAAPRRAADHVRTGSGDNWQIQARAASDQLRDAIDQLAKRN